MSFTHQFAVISKESKEKYIHDNMPSITVSDNLIRYMGDSLSWIHSTWNGKKLRKGISHYGFCVIEDEELKKLKEIIEGWRKLFELAPNQFVITGQFLPDEEWYDKILINKQNIVVMLENWANLCEKALENNDKLLHNGI